MEMINTRRASGTGVGVTVGVVVSVGVAVCEGVAEAVAVDVSVGVNVGSGVAVARKGTFGIWQARRRKVRRTTSFLFCISNFTLEQKSFYAARLGG